MKLKHTDGDGAAPTTTRSVCPFRVCDGDVETIHIVIGVDPEDVQSEMDAIRKAALRRGATLRYSDKSVWRFTRDIFVGEDFVWHEDGNHIRKERVEATLRDEYCEEEILRTFWGAYA